MQCDWTTGVPDNGTEWRKFRERKKHRNTDKFAGLSRDWMGGNNSFMCLFESFPIAEKTHKQNLGRSGEIMFMC